MYFLNYESNLVFDKNQLLLTKYRLNSSRKQYIMKKTHKSINMEESE